jgi:hypothetical protein
MIAAIGAALQVIASPVTEWIKGAAARRRTKEEGKIRVELAKIENQVLQQKQAGGYDVEAQRQMQFSWKDEYLVLVFTIPLILSFLSPFLEMFMPEGITLTDKIGIAWAAVATAPDWYQWSLMGMIAATFGLRWLWTKSPPLRPKAKPE